MDILTAIRNATGPRPGTIQGILVFSSLFLLSLNLFSVISRCCSPWHTLISSAARKIEHKVANFFLNLNPKNLHQSNFEISETYIKGLSKVKNAYTMSHAKNRVLTSFFGTIYEK